MYRNPYQKLKEKTEENDFKKILKLKMLKEENIQIIELNKT